MTERIDNAHKKISIVMPLYNKEDSIRQTILSVANQTHHEFELIIVNDGSTDKSLTAAESVKDERIRIITQKNGGESAARNKGIAESRYDIIAFIDADDTWLPNFLQVILDLSERYPDAGAYSTSFFMCRENKIIRNKYENVTFDINGEILNNYFKCCTLGANMICSSSVAVRSDVFKEIGGFKAGIKNGADLDMWARIAIKYKIAWSPLECAIWELSAENRCAGMTVSDDVPFAEHLEIALKSNTLSNEYKTWIAEYLNKFRISFSEIAFRSNEFKTSRLILEKTKSTKIFKFKRIKLSLRNRTPKYLLMLWYKIRNI